MRLLLLFAALAACRPEPVLNPTKHQGTRGHGEVERDVSHDIAPSGVVMGRDGQQVDLGAMWQEHRVVLVFYMGHWCPHCQKQLGELNQHLKDFGDHGATLVAVSTDSAEDATALKTKLDLHFELYIDPQLAMIAKWGVEDLGTQIARPSTFVIEKGGQISYRKVGDKPTDRPTVDDILAALKNNE